MQKDVNTQSIRATEEALYQTIGQMAAATGIAPGVFLEQFRKAIQKTAHPHRALNNCHRFLSAGFASSLLRDFQAHPILQGIALELFAQSQFLADILVRNPELFHWLTASNALKTTKDTEALAGEARIALQLFNRTEKKLDALKRFQRRELLRIGARQILQEADVTVTSAELSALADVIIQSVLELGVRQFSEGVQMDVENELAIVGLGKLGGEELNFSSDIDLMFVYERDGELNAPHARISSLHEYYNRLSEFVVRRLTEHTGEGHFYRVDMRLRPEGHSGPLAISREGYLVYYESRGELWERQMLIKARIVAGNEKVGKQWLRDVQPFVYPKTFLGSPLDEIARIKAKIESKIEGEENIKLGSGGIRDIEFTVQALQLLNAGMNDRLRINNTLQAVAQLAASSHLTKTEEAKLQRAYVFLRTVEDRLQLLHGLQKHALPGSKEEKSILAAQLGFQSVQQFDKKLERHRTDVRRIFQGVFKTQPRKTSATKELLESAQLPSLLKRHRFLDSSTAQKHLDAILHELPGLRENYRLSEFLRLATMHRAPDWCIENFRLLVSSQPIQRTLQQALANKKLLELLTLICSRSSNLSLLFSREPLLFEILVGRTDELLSEGWGWEFLRTSDPLKYRIYNEIKILLRFILGQVSIQHATSLLSALAEEMSKDVFVKVLEELEAKKNSLKIGVVALGKFGGRELTVGSDLDLIFVYRGDQDIAITRLAQKFVQTFVERMTSLYEIDLRLRPEGKNAPIATELGYYKDYLQHRASFWERQSLMKMRWLTRNKDLELELTRYLENFVFARPLSKGWEKGVRTMKEKMETERATSFGEVDLKVGRGGLVDLEFSLQALQVYFGENTSRQQIVNSFDATKSFVSKRILPRRFLKNLEYLRKLETYVRLNGEKSDFVLPKEDKRLRSLASAMGEKSARAFVSKISRLRKENRAMFLNVLKQVKK